MLEPIVLVEDAWAVPGDPDPPGVPGDQRALAARLRAVVEAKDIELAALRAKLGK